MVASALSGGCVACDLGRESAAGPQPPADVGAARRGHVHASDEEPVPPPKKTFALPKELHDRIGQMVLVGFRGMTAAEAQPTIRNIASGSVGAVELFDVDAETGGPRNIRSREQLRDLISALKAASEIPVLVSVDGEGGFDHRLKERYGFGPAFSTATMGERGDLAFTRASAATIAAQMVDVGIDMNLAPVVDLLNPASLTATSRGRSFSSDPAVVTAHAREFIGAHHDLGVLTTAKHFPGMGGALRPSSPGFGEGIETWSPRELEPYRTLAAEGVLDAVMGTRANHAELDDHYPSTLSSKIINGLLRGELGFDGVVISDALDTLATWDVYGFERGVILAVNAGVDLLLFCNMSATVPYTDERGPACVQVILDAVARGEIAESRVDEACRRVLALKSRLLA